MNTDFFFSEGAFIFIIFVLGLLLSRPKTIPFTLKSVSLFIIIRSCFVVMTHLGPPAGYISTDLSNYRYVTSGADLFFSGHTGLSFLMCLIFWDNKKLRYLFLFTSILAGVTVLFGHLHYTIDVFSAFFITHGVYLMSKKFFKKDLKLFNS